MDRFQRGDEVMYLPDHAKGDWTLPCCEFGIVTAASDNGCVFVEFERGGVPKSCCPRNLLLVSEINVEE